MEKNTSQPEGLKGVLKYIEFEWKQFLLRGNLLYAKSAPKTWKLIALKSYIRLCYG